MKDSNHMKRAAFYIYSSHATKSQSRVSIHYRSIGKIPLYSTLHSPIHGLFSPPSCRLVTQCSLLVCASHQCVTCHMLNKQLRFEWLGSLGYHKTNILMARFSWIKIRRYRLHTPWTVRCRNSLIL